MTPPAQSEPTSAASDLPTVHFILIPLFAVSQENDRLVTVAVEKTANNGSIGTQFIARSEHARAAMANGAYG
jgi:hypothetical protein